MPGAVKKYGKSSPPVTVLHPSNSAATHPAPSAATVHATEHGQTGTTATPHDAAHAAAHAGNLHGNEAAHAAAKDAKLVAGKKAGESFMIDSKGGKYKLSPGGKKEYVGK
jgi:hypothetical protein